MGSFIGHVVPGSFFVVFALWHIVQTCLRYFNSLRPDGAPFMSATYYVTTSCPCRPVECYLKLGAVLAGIIMETIGLFVYGAGGAILTAQHMTMFVFFGIVAVLELLYHYRFHLPPDAVYLAYTLAFGSEGLIFFWHLHGRSPLDIQVHTFLIYTIFATVLCVNLEMCQKFSLPPTLCRSYCVLLQGLWFLQVAFILYPPGHMQLWNPEDHEQMMIITVLFCTWALIAFILVCFIWFVVACRFGMGRRSRNLEKQEKNRFYFGGRDYKSLTALLRFQRDHLISRQTTNGSSVKEVFSSFDETDED